MSLQVNRVPIALSDLIGGRTWSKNLHAMADTGALVYDMREEFLGSRIEYANSTVSANSVSQYGAASFPALTVPNDEAWWVKWVGAFAPSGGSLGAGQTIQLSAGLYLRSQSGTNLYAFGEPSNVATVGLAATAAQFQPNCWITGGMSAAIMVQQVAAGPISCMVQIAFVRCKV